MLPLVGFEPGSLKNGSQVWIPVRKQNFFQKIAYFSYCVFEPFFIEGCIWSWHFKKIGLDLFEKPKIISILKTRTLNFKATLKNLEEKLCDDLIPIWQENPAWHANYLINDEPMIWLKGLLRIRRKLAKNPSDCFTCNFWRILQQNSCQQLNFAASSNELAQHHLSFSWDDSQQQYFLLC